MKILLFAFLLTIICCNDKPEHCYSFDVYLSGNGLIRVDYFADIGGYTLLLGCEPDVTTETAYEVKVEPERMSGGWALTRVCTPTYVRIINSIGTEEKKI